MSAAAAAALFQIAARSRHHALRSYSSIPITSTLVPSSLTYSHSYTPLATLVIHHSFPFNSSSIFRSYAAVSSSTSNSSYPIHKLRNIGISAHIDSGKTTLTERVLFYTGRIGAIHEVRGRDGVGAKMDFMELEREKGITIQSAATYCQWKENNFNIIDTPGHVDFTIEVERALRVLDGAVLVLCSVAGVQSQSMTVDRQMKRYGVPRIVFINKLDRVGANPWRGIDMINAKLKTPAAALQVPDGLEADLKGLVDLVEMKYLTFSGNFGEIITNSDTIPSHLNDLVNKRKQILIETLADVDEEFGDKFLMEEEITVQDMKAAIRRATLARKFSPVLMGTALKNTGVQPLLDAVVEYLPNPTEQPNFGIRIVKKEEEIQRDVDGKTKTDIVAKDVEEKFQIPCDKNGPLVALAFKLEDGRFGQLTFIRIYSGTVKKGDFVLNVRTGKKVKLQRLVQMHAQDMEDVPQLEAGNIGATFGIECASGDTFVGLTDPRVSMESTYVPEPVVSLAIEPKNREHAGGAGRFTKALSRFTREDPTFRVHMDPESNQTIISGMGELHLEVYCERIKREYGIECNVGAPKVNYRETITQRADFEYLHKKQSGGAGQFAGVSGFIEPHADITQNQFENAVIGNAIPPNFFVAIEKGFKEVVKEGVLTGHAVQGVTFVVNDGRSHPVDSNELAFRMATIMAFRDAYKRAGVIVLEPVMSVEVTAPVEFQATVMTSINRRRGIVTNSQTHLDYFEINCEVSLGEMFGYSMELRSLTQGKGEFSMEYLEHRQAPSNVQAKLAEEYAAKKKKEEEAKK